MEKYATPYPTIPGKALLAFYPSLLLKFKLHTIPNHSIHPTAAQCFTLPLLKPFLTLPITPLNLFYQALPSSPYQYPCKMSYSMVEEEGLGLHNYGMLNGLYVIR